MIKSLYPQLQRWCEHGSVWIISDTHFDDGDCALIDPSWIYPEDHMSILKRNIMAGDTLIHLGDIGNPEYLRGLRCYKVLITGNHDAGAAVYKEYFDEIYTGPLFIADRILLSHEPIYGLESFCINIHGHVHCREDSRLEPGHVNLASDVVNFQPFNLGAEIKKGLLAGIPNYHRLTIDNASKNPIHKEKSE